MNVLPPDAMHGARFIAAYGDGGDSFSPWVSSVIYNQRVPAARVQLLALTTLTAGAATLLFKFFRTRRGVIGVVVGLVLPAFVLTVYRCVSLCLKIQRALPIFEERLNSVCDELNKPSPLAGAGESMKALAIFIQHCAPDRCEHEWAFHSPKKAVAFGRILHVLQSQGVVIPVYTRRDLLAVDDHIPSLTTALRDLMDTNMLTQHNCNMLLESLFTVKHINDELVKLQVEQGISLPQNIRAQMFVHTKYASNVTSFFEILRILYKKERHLFSEKNIVAILTSRHGIYTIECVLQRFHEAGPHRTLLLNEFNTILEHAPRFRDAMGTVFPYLEPLWEHTTKLRILEEFDRVMRELE